MATKLTAEKCDKCGLLKAGHLHQFPVCAIEAIKEKQNELERLREAICIYMREEDQRYVKPDDIEGREDEEAIDWFCDQYSERNYE